MVFISHILAIVHMVSISHIPAIVHMVFIFHILAIVHKVNYIVASFTLPSILQMIAIDPRVAPVDIASIVDLLPCPQGCLEPAGVLPATAPPLLVPVLGREGDTPQGRL